MKEQYTSNTVEWETPQDFFDKLDAEFHFTLDVCATNDNAKCDKYFNKETDGLFQAWAGEVCWMNPPYSKEIKQWLRRAHYVTQTFGTTVVCLIPARTDTSWWHDYVLPHEIRYVRGRLKFGPNASNKRRAPFPNAVVIMRKTT